MKRYEHLNGWVLTVAIENIEILKSINDPVKLGLFLVNEFMKDATKSSEAVLKDLNNPL